MEKAGKTDVLIGIEPTGHYWFTFEKFIRSKGMRLVFVNPFAVKRLKELDDNSPKKTDLKDPKTIGKLVVDGRYCYPYIPEGIYQDLREVASSRDRIMKEHCIACNRIQRWLKIYFPEYVGMKKAMSLVEAAHNSVGIEGGNGARTELKLLIEDYRTKQTQLEKVTQNMMELTLQVPYAEKLLAIKGIGIVTVAGFLAEAGDIRRFESPKQIQKLAGLELVENSSGKKKGQTSISKRGRKKLRKLLFQVVLPLIAKNREFGEIYDYYHNRLQNPLKGRQAMIAVSCKLIRIFFAILKKGMDYDAEKMLKDIRRPKAA